MGNFYDHLSDREIMLLTAQKVDFMANEFLESRQTQTKACNEHRAWTAAVQKRVENLPEQEPFKTTIAQATAHEAIKNRMFAAARLIAWASGAVTVIGGIITAAAKFWHHGGKP